MRLTSTLATSALALSLAVPLTVVGAATTTTSASAATPACSMALDPDRRTTYRLKAGTRVLPYGQVVVQATRADYHRYCVRFQTGGRTVVHSFSLGDYTRSGGTCRSTGQGLGSGVYRTGSYTQDVRVRDGRCTAVSYAIRDSGTWYVARALRWNEPG